MVRALGYPTLISLESFRTPNFPLVADLLVWLSKRFDPDVEIPLEIDSEGQRVKLVRTAAQFMALKANIKVNTKRLYQADGYAVKELLKIAGLLYEALNLDLDGEKQDDSFEDESFTLRNFDLSDKVNELKLSRQLASEITSTGATLFDLLGKEVDLRSARQKSVGRQFELTEVEAGIRTAIEGIKEELAQTKQLIDNVSVTEASLDSKIERRKVEIDRYDKRLQTLKKVRPAFLDEFTALEAELEQLFVQYALRLRVLNQLERLFSDAERAQLEKQLLTASPKIETIPLDGGDMDLFLGFEDTNNKSNKQERPRAGTGGGRSRTAKGAKAYGGMQPPMSATPSFSSDSESDELFIDKDESELIPSDDESLGLELSGMERTNKRAPSSKNMSVSRNNMLNSISDDDF